MGVKIKHKQNCYNVEKLLGFVALSGEQESI